MTPARAMVRTFNRVDISIYGQWQKRFERCTPRLAAIAIKDRTPKFTANGTTAVEMPRSFHASHHGFMYPSIYVCSRLPCVFYAYVAFI